MTACRSNTSSIKKSCFKLTFCLCHYSFPVETFYRSVFERFFVLNMTIFIDEGFFPRRKQPLRHRYSLDHRGEHPRPSRRATDGRMARASPVSPHGDPGNPFSNPNRPIPPVVRGATSFHQRSSSRFKDGDVSCSGSSVPNHYNRYDKHSDDATAALRLPAPDEEFSELSRLFYKIIKLCHHLNNVAPADDDRIPSSIHHMMHQLSAMIKPAFPDHSVCASIKYNAQQWCSSTLRTLEQHYSTLLSDLLLDVAHISPRAWLSPFLVATRWAKKNFPRLHHTTLDRAKQLITTHAGDTAPLPRPPTSADPPASPAVPAPPLLSDTPHLKPTTRESHPPPSTSPSAGKTKKHRPPPKASTLPGQTPRLSKQQDLQLHGDRTSGDDERPCTSASRPPECHGVNNPPLKLRGAGQPVLTDPRDADAADDSYDDDEPEEFYDTNDESLTQALDQLKSTLQRSLTPTCSTHAKNNKNISKKHKILIK